MERACDSRTILDMSANYIKSRNATMLGGWIEYNSVIPTRASADDPIYVLTFAGVDLTSIISIGMRVKWTQNSTVRYGIIQVVTFSTNTTMTVYGGTDYDVDDTATYTISAFAYSPVKVPAGFPSSPLKWQVTLNDTADNGQNSPVQGTWYNPGTLTISAPIGIWDVTFSATVLTRHASSASGTMSNQFALSTANNSVSDTNLFSNSALTLDAITNHYNHHKNSLCAAIAVTGKTTFYLICRRADAIGDTRVAFRGDLNPTRVVLTNSYL